MKHVLLLVFLLGIGYATAGPASAAPVMPAGFDNTVRSVLAEDVIRIHGYHRRCDRGFVHRWRTRAWHRHRGNRRVSECRPRREFRRDRRNRYRHRDGCVNIGGVRICN
jgi:hypothetical protein